MLTTLFRTHRAGRGTAVARMVAAAAVAAAAVAATAPTAAAGATVAAGPLAVTATVTVPGVGRQLAGAAAGQVGSAQLAFVASGTQNAAGVFTFTTTCTEPGGADCAADAAIDWDFGDGQHQAGASATHTYQTPGKYIATVTATTAAAHGTARVPVLVSPQFADVTTSSLDAATDWAPVAAGLMNICAASYTPTSATGVINPSAYAPGQALFCPKNGTFPPSILATTRAFPAVNPAPAYGAGADCLANAGNCGLPVAAFFTGVNTNPQAACGAACVARLEALGLIAPAPSGVTPAFDLLYDPNNCADNMRASATAGGTVTITRGVEPGCETSGDWLASLQKAIDGQADLSNTTLVTDTRTCTSGPTPTPGARRAAALLTRTDSPVSPCDGDTAVTKGDAYRILAAAIGASGGTAPVTLPDLADMTLGGGAATPYPYAAQVRAVLAAGAPLVGDTTCPTGGLCFNPQQALTRAQAGQLLTFALTSPLAPATAVTATLTTDDAELTAGGATVARLTIAVPAELVPRQATWTLGVAAPADATQVDFTCPTSGTATITDDPYILACPITVKGSPASDMITLTANVDGALAVADIHVADRAPWVTGVTAQGRPVADGTITWEDPDGDQLSTAELAPTPAGPWATTLSDANFTATAGPVAGSGPVPLTITPAGIWAGAAVFYARVCDTQGVCSLPRRAEIDVAATTPLPAVTTPAGVNPYVAALSPDGRTVITADMDAGTATTFTIDPVTLQLTKIATNPIDPYPFDLSFSPDGTLVAVASYGTGSVTVYRYGASNGKLHALATAATGAMASAVTFSPDGNWLAVANRGASTVTLVRYNATNGKVTVAATKPTGAVPASVAFSPDGRTLAVANVNDASLSLYKVDTTGTGTLTPTGSVATDMNPTHVTFSPDGRWAAAAAAGSSRINLYAVNSTTGALAPARTVATGNYPTWVAFSPDGTRLASADTGAGTATVFTFDTATGKGTAPGTVTTGAGPQSVSFGPDSSWLLTANYTSGTLTTARMPAR